MSTLSDTYQKTDPWLHDVNETVRLCQSALKEATIQNSEYHLIVLKKGGSQPFALDAHIFSATIDCNTHCRCKYQYVLRGLGLPDKRPQGPILH